MILNVHEVAEFEKAAQPLMDFLRRRCHPHCSAIVTATEAEVVEGLARTVRSVPEVAAGWGDAGQEWLVKG